MLKRKFKWAHFMRRAFIIVTPPPSYYLSDRIKKLKLTQLEIVKFKPKQV